MLKTKKRNKPLSHARKPLFKAMRKLAVGSGRLKSKKTKNGLPPWLKAVPEGKHGSGTLQKRLWRLKSDFVRIRDWHTWGPRCIATGRHLESWSAGQAGHFKSYTKCNGMYKFNENNIHLQSAMSNSWPDKDDWNHFEMELVARYGPRFVQQIEEDNKATDVRITTELVMAEIRRTITSLKELPEQPKYFKRLTSLREKDKEGDKTGQ